jgi:hypothetical protein
MDTTNNFKEGTEEYFKRNLKIMQQALLTDPTINLSMERWAAPAELEVGYDPEREGHMCGSLGCVVGHAPSYIPLVEEDIICDFVRMVPCINYSGYSRRVFGVFEDDWAWLFSSSWGEVDDTVEGAAQRIEMLLDIGCAPEWFEEVELDDSHYDEGSFATLYGSEMDEYRHHGS